MLRKIPLSTRLIIGVVGSLILVLGLMTALSYVVVQGYLSAALQQQVLNLATTKVGEIDGFFRELGTIPVVLASASAVDQENDETLLRDRIRRTLENNPSAYGSTVAFEPYTFYATQKYFSPYYSRTADWTSFNYVQLGTDDYVYFRDWEWYTGARDSGELYWTLPYFDEGAGNIWMVTASYPVVRENKFTGVATVDIPIEDIREGLDELRVGERGYALMFGPTGGIIATSGMEGLGESTTVQELTSQIDDPAFDALLKTVMQGGSGVQEVPDAISGGGTLWAIYTTVSSTQWHVVTFVSAQEMLVSVNQVLGLMAGISLLGMVLLAAIILGISNTVTKPLSVLQGEALAVAAGDLTRRVPVEGRDEITAMSQAFNHMADEVQSLLNTTEQRVAERTAKLRAAADVSRTTTSVLNPDELLNQVVDLVQDRFGLYYVGLFLLDEAGEYAVLRAGTGEAGRQMLLREHKLLVGGDSMIGQCVSRAAARISLDVGEGAVRFENPLLPETRSEMALPLRSRGRVTGAMSVQSKEAQAFDETDISVMQTMADQVATAIDNAQLFVQTQESLEAERRAYGELSRKSWQAMLRSRGNVGYRYEGKSVEPLVLTSQKETSQDIIALPEVTLPLQIRGHEVGRISVHKEFGTEGWTEDEISLLNALAEQLNLALDSVRLYQDTQRRALQERVVAEAADHMRRATDMDTLIRTTIEEMSSALGISGAFVQLAPEAELMADQDGKEPASSAEEAKSQS
ncbi:MAG: GAF domain-containing protein [Anaerolineae bacterium]|jgi:GAF domain-containing protein/HAMP domain-containing protein|nr:GAF domain-containing protein [Anaerolineae bacterium]